MATLISEVLREPQYSDSPLGHAESELSELKGTKRLDLAILSRQDPGKPIITAELKLPWRAEGRTPYNTQLVSDAHAKASRAGALYFITWNVRRLVVWQTDNPGVELERRVIYDNEAFTSAIRSELDLDRSEVKAALVKAVRDVLQFAHSLLVGLREPSFLPLDRLFIANLEAALYFPIESTVQTIRDLISGEPRFRRELERWMRDEQKWIVSKATEEENIERAARFSCYVLVNRLCFYNALRRKYKELPRLTVANSIVTGAMLRKKLDRAFSDAKRFTGDYETVFDGDFGDNLPFLADDATEEWRRLIRSLDHYDFANMSVDIIGGMYEQLIHPEERHRYGQHYTQPEVVDLINAFSISSAHAHVLDPACGGGTFLVRAYARKRYIDPELDHSELLESLYGCDILSYACHLSTINLAVRDLIDDDNFPRIHHGDFLRYKANQIFIEQPERVQAGGLILGKRPIRLQAKQFDAIVGNPPYINARDLPAKDRESYAQGASSEWPQYLWRSRSDIYTYFWTHSAQFLKKGGYLALLTQAAWLDVEYGFPLQDWMLDNFVIEAIMESESEPWFTDARVATVIAILSREEDSSIRERNNVKFVQFTARLEDVLRGDDSESARQKAADRLRDDIRGALRDSDSRDYRIRIVSQGKLRATGTDSAGKYCGSKWGRYLRSIGSLYELQNRVSSSFVRLDHLAHIRRGVTTNRDEFFIVADVTNEALERITGDRTFREKHGASRREVDAGKVAVIRRSDGVELPLEREYLRSIIKTGRDVDFLSTKKVGVQEYAVIFRGPRDGLSKFARAYIEAGERREWHKTPSFGGRHEADNPWYVLQQAEIAPILFIKTMQYTPLVLWNDGMFIANQRLYGVTPHSNIDPGILCAVLNSTVFAAERYATVKALGREAAIDVEVFAAGLLRTPRVDSLRDSDLVELQAAFSVLCQRKIQPFLEETLRHAGRAEAHSYIARQPVCRAVWPDELQDEARRAIDRIVLRALGLKESDIEKFIDLLYDELTAHTRKLRLLELEAQKNRRGVKSGSPSPRELADEVWSQLFEQGILEARIPEDFIPADKRVETFRIPAVSRFLVLEPSLFDVRPRFAIRAGKEELEAHSREQLDYIRFLMECGISGEVAAPMEKSDCSDITAKMKEYWSQVRDHVVSAASEITGNQELQAKIVREALRRLVLR